MRRYQISVVVEDQGAHIELMNMRVLIMRKLEEAKLKPIMGSLYLDVLPEASANTSTENICHVRTGT